MRRKIILILGILIFYNFPIYARQCDPFTINCRNSNEVLTKYVLSELKMGGSISKEGKIWAVIKAPDQHIYAVKIGDPIGLSGGKVSNITSQQVIVEQENKRVIIRAR